MIGIICAMVQEADKMIASMDHVDTQEVAGRRVCTGKIEGQDVVLVQSGVGKVSMALCSQMLIDRYQVEALINTGVAGSLDARIDIGDIVIGTDAVQYDMDTTACGDPLGQITGVDVLAFPCDEKLAALAESLSPVPTHRGRIATGDKFIAKQEEKDAIIEAFDACCCEMEGAAMAHVAYLNKVPCLILRAISDKADGSAHMSFEEFKLKAMDNAVELLHRILKAW